MLEATNITYRVGDKTLISNASASFAPGQLHLIVGPNGAGKSTLIKVLARFLHPQAGTVRYEAADVKDANESELAKRRAVLSQAIEVAFPLTVREIVLMGRYPHFGGRPGPHDEEIVDEVMQFFDVNEFADRNYQTLSGGERQRVNFARVLAQLWREANGHSARPCRYLLLDEPLTFLDVRHQIDFMKKVRRFAESPDVVAVGVVHDLNLAARFADRLLLLDHGEVVGAGPAEELLTSENISRVFGVRTTFIPSPSSGVHMIFD